MSPVSDGTDSSAVGRGIACMLGGTVLLTLNDALVKWLVADYPVGEVLFFRGGVVVVGVAGVLWWRGGAGAFRVADPKGQAARALLVVASSFLFINGLRYLPLADAIAIAFAGPLFTTVLAVPLLGERVGWRRWLAVLIGFFGVVVMTRPGAGIVQWAALLPLGACLAGALRDIVTRRLTALDRSLVTLFYTTTAVTLAGAVTLAWDWRPPELGDLGLLLLSSVLLAGAHYLQIEAFRHAEAVAIVPYRYTSLIWALLLGFFVWGHLPDATVLFGAIGIVASGLYIWHRERRRAGGMASRRRERG
jgi:drug/metabolite transporter (DMT)-like permease